MGKTSGGRGVGGYPPGVNPNQNLNQVELNAMITRAPFFRT